MRVLGISSATKVISIGLIDKAQVVVSATVADMAAEKIVFYIKEAGIKPEQIEAVAVAQGPGSYSGLRGGLATAKSLAQTLKIPLVGVSTLEAIAYNLIDYQGTMVAKLPAKLDEYNMALFGSYRGQLKRITEDLVLKEDKIKGFLSKVAGELKVVDGQKDHPYGINVAKLGLLKIKAGQTSDPLKLTPNYSHKPKFKEFML